MALTGIHSFYWMETEPQLHRSQLARARNGGIGVFIVGLRFWAALGREARLIGWPPHAINLHLGELKFNVTGPNRMDLKLREPKY